MAFLTCLALPSQSQDVLDAESDVIGGDDMVRISPEDMPVSAEELGEVLEEIDDSEVFSREEILVLMADIYRYQAEILSATARNDSAETEMLLEETLADLLRLSRAAGVDTMPRYRELYRSVIGEYEAFFGEMDSLSAAYGNIFGFRARMFASLNEVDEPLLEDVVMPELGPVSTVVPMPINRVVERSLTYLRREPDKHLHLWLARAETYFPMIEQILAEEGVPDELKYLAMIESGLNPRARSWARAVGMWQFIGGTGRAYGLRVDGWVDERMDPEKATRAAARHLRDLYEMFGDWHLALAGYNYSPGKLKRRIRRVEAELGREATYWDVYRYIPRETRNYVPMFIATALITSQPEAFGVKKVEPGPKYEYHYVPVQGMMTLVELADMAGTTPEAMKALNPELRRSALPPSRKPYWIRIPYGTYDRFEKAYAELPESERRPATEHIVRRGETLSQIAGLYGTSWRELQRKNGLRGTSIRIGQRLAVPVNDYDPAGVGANLAEAGSVTVRYGSRLIRPVALHSESESSLTELASDTTPTAAPVRKAAEPPAGQTRIVYRVKSGDTLGELAEKYGVRASQLRSWNNLRGSRINVGQRLVIYTDNPPADGSGVTHTVQRGDTLGKIGSRYGVSVTDLKRWNGLESSTIHPGQRLVVSGSSSSSETVTYTVRRGDNLTEIARRHGVSVSNIRQWNNLSSSVIQVGQKLTIRP
jgi:membrane-bound lytic murein transglycosylase D